MEASLQCLLWYGLKQHYYISYGPPYPQALQLKWLFNLEYKKKLHGSAGLVYMEGATFAQACVLRKTAVSKVICWTKSTQNWQSLISLFIISFLYRVRQNDLTHL